MSQFGAGAACACETGEIVNHEVMSLHCDKCKTYKAEHTKQKFEEWWVTHKDSNECEINFSG